MLIIAPTTLIAVSSDAAAATSPSNFGSDEPIGLCLAPDDALAVLEHWQSTGQRLGFSFLRSPSGVFLEGQATVARVCASTLTFDAGDRRLAVAIENACIEFTQGRFCRQGFRAFDAEGLSVSLVNGDWLFLFQETSGHARYSRYRAEPAVGSLAARTLRGARPRAGVCLRPLVSANCGDRCKSVGASVCRRG